MEERLSKIEKDIELLQLRNVRVEGEKAWEISSARKMLIAAITYIVAVIVMSAISVNNYFINALIPTVGYLLSTISIPWVKKWWIVKHQATPTTKQR